MDGGGVRWCCCELLLPSTRSRHLLSVQKGNGGDEGFQGGAKWVSVLGDRLGYDGTSG